MLAILRWLMSSGIVNNSDWSKTDAVRMNSGLKYDSSDH